MGQIDLKIGFFKGKIISFVGFLFISNNVRRWQCSAALKAVMLWLDSPRTAAAPQTNVHWLAIWFLEHHYSRSGISAPRVPRFAATMGKDLLFIWNPRANFFRNVPPYKKRAVTRRDRVTAQTLPPLQQKCKGKHHKRICQQAGILLDQQRISSLKRNAPTRTYLKSTSPPYFGVQRWPEWNVAPNRKCASSRRPLPSGTPHFPYFQSFSSCGAASRFFLHVFFGACPASSISVPVQFEFFTLNLKSIDKTKRRGVDRDRTADLD